MRTLLALSVLTLGLTAAGSAMASDDRDEKHDRSANTRRERSLDDDRSGHDSKHETERDELKSGQSHHDDDDGKAGRKGERHDGGRS